jgi:hypothetical protein
MELARHSQFYLILGVLIAVIRIGYAEPFFYFKRMVFDDTFLRLYDKGLKRWRNALFTLSSVSVLLFALMLTALSAQVEWLNFNVLTALVGLTALLLLKYAVRRLLAFAHHARGFFDTTQVYAQSYFAYAGIMAFILGVTLDLYPELNHIISWILGVLVIGLQTKCYYGVINHLLRRKPEKLLLFIFYLCALEIAPVVVVYTLSI